jgi:hypothetical protein
MSFDDGSHLHELCTIKKPMLSGESMGISLTDVSVNSVASY